MNGSCNGGVRRHRVGVRFAEASVASRSEANTNAMQARFLSRGFSLSHCFGLRISASCILGWTHATSIGFPEFADQKPRKIHRPFPFASQPQSHRISNKRLSYEPLPSSPTNLSVASYS